METAKKGNFIVNWDHSYEPLGSTYNDGEIKSRDDFYQLLGYHYTYEDIVRYVNKPVHEIRTLEVGCGGARTSVFLAKKGMNVTVTDFSPEALRLARTNFEKGGIKRFAAIQDDLLNSKLDPGAYDVVMSFGLLEHFEDLRGPFRQMARLLRPGGIQIHDIITDRFSVQHLSFAWNATARFVKRLVTGRWKELAGQFKRNFPHYENSYPLDHYVDIMRDTGSELLYRGGLFLPFPR